MVDVKKIKANMYLLKTKKLGVIHLLSCAIGLCMISIISENKLIWGVDKNNSTRTTKTTDTDDDYQLAKDQSFGFFADVPSSFWKRHHKIASRYQPHLDAGNPLVFAPNSPASFYQTNYDPNFSCSFEVRVGKNGNGDGPKWVCDPHNLIRLAEERRMKDSSVPGCLIYSVGSNGDFSFEEGIQELMGSSDVCEIHIFDMGDFEDKMPKGLNLHYHKVGLAKQKPEGDKEMLEIDWPKKEDKSLFMGIRDIVKKLGHENRTAIDIFKIDCENCEWETFGDWFDPSIPKMQQILVETHGAPRNTVLNFFDGIANAGYMMFHKEANILGCGGSCIEFAFLKLDQPFHDDVNALKKD